MIGSENPWSHRGRSVHHFVLVSIAGDRLDGQVIGPDGGTIDRFAIDRGRIPDDVVYYERIQVIDAMREPAVLDAKGGAFKALLEPEAPTCEAKIVVRNPIPESIVTTVSLGDSDGYRWEPKDVR